MIRQTSLLAIQDIRSDGTAQTQRNKIRDFLKKFDGLTRNEISRLLGIKINAVCGRTNELMKSQLVYEEGKRKDRFSQKENYILKSAMVVEQRSLE